MNIKSTYELQKEATEKMKELIKAMNRLSEEEFVNKYCNDPCFHKGFDTLVMVFMEAKIY